MSDADATSKKLKEELGAMREDAADLLDNLRDLFARSRDEVVRSARVGRLRVEVYQYRKDREQLLLRLGEQVFQLIEDGSLKGHQSDDLLKQIHELDVTIRGMEEEIELGQDGESEASVPSSKKPAAKKPAAKKTAAK